MPLTGRQIQLDAYPRGELRASDFRLAQVPLHEPAPGEVLVRNTWTSVDPGLRLRLRESERTARAVVRRLPRGRCRRGEHRAAVGHQFVRGWRLVGGQGTVHDHPRHHRGRGCPADLEQRAAGEPAALARRGIRPRDLSAEPPFQAGDERRILCRQAVVRSVLPETRVTLPVLPRPRAAVPRSARSPRPPAARE